MSENACRSSGRPVATYRKNSCKRNIEKSASGEALWRGRALGFSDGGLDLALALCGAQPLEAVSNLREMLGASNRDGEEASRACMKPSQRRLAAAWRRSAYGQL